jgi:hypothetical protein
MMTGKRKTCAIKVTFPSLPSQSLKLIGRQANISQDFAQCAFGNISAGMNGHGRPSPVRMLIDCMAATLADAPKSQSLQHPHNLLRASWSQLRQ